MQTPATETPKLRPRSGRTPLKPINTPTELTTNTATKPKIQPKLELKPEFKPDQSYFEITPIQNAEKTNPISTSAPPLETSLAEELSAIKKKLERLKTEKEKTEKMLKEREALLDVKLKEMEEKGEIQKNLEIQVDRLFRLKELKYRCMRVSPIRTLREKEHEKIVNEAPSPSEVKTEETVAYESESVKDESRGIESPGSACSQTKTTQKI